VDAAQRVVDGVGDEDVVAQRLAQLLRHEAQAVGLAEPRVVTVDQPALTGADPPHERLAVDRQLGERVVPRVGHQEVAARQGHGLGGEPQRAGRGLRRHVRAVAAVQRALGVVLRDQLVHDRLDRGRVPLPRHLRDDVPLGVDHHQRRPGAGGVRAPGDELGVVQHRVVHLVPLDGGRQRVRVRLVRELGRVHAHDHQLVAVAILQLTQLVQHVQAVDATEGPEVEDHDLPPQVGEGDVVAAGVEPAPPDECGRADAGRSRRCGHPSIVTGPVSRRR
jgi:hypothetical protein